MRKHFLYILLFLCCKTSFSQITPNAGTTPVVTGVKQLPAAFTLTPANYLRTFTPQIPMQDTLQVNMAAPVENVQTAIMYADSYGRTIESVAKQLSPNKKDNVSVGNYDEFGRAGTLSYMPYTALSNDGSFKQNAFAEDSAFYKSLYPLEQVIYSQTQYDGSPMNIPIKGLAVGNEWGGANRGKMLVHRSSTAADSVRYWNIDILTEDDLPSTTGYYLPATLNVKEITDERGIKSISYTDLAGRTILTKTQEANSPGTGHYGWLCTYYVYDEMGSLRIVVPPKAVQQLAASSWQCTTVIMQGLCYSYFYDNRGRQITKSIPGKGKSYIAYDLLDRPVMTQDPNLRQTNQWAFVLYDAQSRPIQSGTITTALLKDSLQAEAARSVAYPTLTGTYTVMAETYYDNYDWVAATGAPVTASVNSSNINSSNFITGYNSAPDYAQPLTQSLRIRGAVTGTKTIVLGTSDYNYAVTMYDNYGRAIQTQQRNHTGGTDIATMQYSYKGTVLRSHLTHSKGGSNAQSHSMLTKYSYDHVGRLLSTTKNIDNLGDKTITQLAYEETGQIKTKTLGGGLQVQNYSYNIQGMLTAINAPYVTANSSTGNEYFGEILSYAHGFTANQYNGGIAGVQWKNAGDGIARAYGYSYDNVGRLSKADFTQQNSGSTAWTNDKVDYSVKGLSYDGGGNIMSMTQRGLLGVGGNATIDSLAYSYFANSNRLQKVTDAAVGGGGLGDFKDSTNTNDDYAYDVNGNIVADNNRHLHNANGSIGTVFNLLDKPDSMAVAGKSCTYYKYDAAGTLLTKIVKDYKNNSIKNYSYAAGFVYLNDTLQYAMMEEGRIRIPVSTGQFSQVIAIYDYFIKDHAGNIRTVVTDEARIDDYPAATMDTTTAIKNVENAIYAGLDLTRVAKPSGYPSADDLPIPNTNNFVAKVQGNAGSQKVGPSITLKVMKGDKFDFYVSSFYQTATPTSPIGSPLNDIVNGLINGVSGSAVVNTHGITTSQFQSSGILNTGINDFLGNQPDNSGGTKPRAYVNWVLLDEQFNLVQSSSGFEQVSDQGVIEPHTRQNLPITQSGYLYIYVSNNTPNIPVYFDNLKVKHTRGALLETNEFYPYGLKMASISYKASMTITNRNGFNGGNEYEDEGELNYSTTFYRKYDAQIGRFTGVDMLADDYADFSPYQFAGNNPVMFNDPTGAALSGLQWDAVINNLWVSNFGGHSNEHGYETHFNSNDEALGAGFAYMDMTDSWGARGGWATSAGDALSRYVSSTDVSGGRKGWTYITKTFSASFSVTNFIGDKVLMAGRVIEEYQCAGYGNVFNASDILAGYAIQTQPLSEKILEATHATLEMTSFLPIIGTASAGINSAIYLGQGDLKNAAISAAEMIPFEKVAAAGLKYGGVALGALVKQSHHLIPNQIYKEVGKDFMKGMGWVQNHKQNLMNLSFPFHGNHPRYNNYVRERVGNVFRERTGVQGLINLQNELRGEIQNILNSGYTGNLNDYYKALGY